MPTINYSEYKISDMDIERIIADHYPELAGVHPAANIIPLPTQEEFEELCKDIANQGLVDNLDVQTSTDLLLDGRSRLLAGYVTGQELRFNYLNVDDGFAYNHSISKNLKRRHLSIGQKAMIAMDLAQSAEFRANGKEKQSEGGGDRKSEQYKEKIALSEFGQSDNSIDSMKQAADTLGISKTSVGVAMEVDRHVPEKAAEVRSGKLSLNEAHKAAKKEKTRKARLGGLEKSQPTSGNVAQIVTSDGRAVDIDEPKKVVFNETNDNVSWAAYTWNPVTGCNHGCNFCYAREIAHLDKMRPFYPFKFEPAFHEYRLAAPGNTPLPKDLKDPRKGRVFVCSMADLFGKWVPQEWIEAVFQACLDSPKWQYLFLTKWPARYAQLPLIENAWYGASIVRQSDVNRVTKAMQAVSDQPVTRWISMEPMLGPIVLDDISWCDLMVIGGQTETNQPSGKVEAVAPHFEWVYEVVRQCKSQNVPYYLKPNLGSEPGMVLPQMNPRPIKTPSS